MCTRVDSGSNQSRLVIESGSKPARRKTRIKYDTYAEASLARGSTERKSLGRDFETSERLSPVLRFAATRDQLSIGIRL